MSHGSKSATRIMPLLSWRGAIGESDLSPTARHVALALSIYMSEKGENAHPGPTRLARETGWCLRVVKSALKELTDSGWLVLVERGGLPGHRKMANVYRAAVPVHQRTGAAGAPVQEVQGYPCTTGNAPVQVVHPISPENSPMNSPAVASAPRTRTKGTRVPDPFPVSDEMVAWADLEIPNFDWPRETSKFLDYWRAKPGSGGVKLDWAATWRNWMRTANERAGAR